MPLSDGTRLGPYDIVAPLGAGGMGEVYRATDTRLKRQVAIKILPPQLAADPDRLARFQREAEVLASLNHPHIAAVYGLEESTSAGVKALVMELVEGRTLADRIAEGSIPIDEALPIARQIAEALEAAHERGIVHRDLKPANIKVREDGTVKVLDFGLAKLAESGAGRGEVTESDPTLVSPVAVTAVTQIGVILGTATYMSPEQARGRAVDKRTDIWAFGAVLYEMLSGVRAFDGEDVAELIAAVMKTTPKWSALPADVPPHVVTLIQRCLEKDRNARVGDIAVARFLLSGDIAAAAGAVASPRSSAAPPWLRTLPWIAAAALAGAAIGWFMPRRSGGTSPATHLQTDVRPAEQITVSGFGGERPARISIALAPDGRRIVFVGARAGGSQLYERLLDRDEATALPGTENATAPFISPDGAWVGFIADGKIKKVPAGDGPAAAICDLPAGAAFWGASWGEDGNVFFAARTGIFKVPSGGGTPVVVTTVDPLKFDRHLLPQLLPGGNTLLFTAPPNIAVLTLGTGEQRTLLEGSDARYVDTGHLVFMKSGTLMAAPFDVKSARITGGPVAVVDGVMHGVNAGNTFDETQAGQFAVSRSGTLIYALGGITPNHQTSLTWVDRKGATQAVPGGSGRTFMYPHLSPDSQKILMQIRRDASRDTDLWVHDIARGAATRLTFDGGGSPVWSPDGKRVVYSFGANGGPGNLHIMNADGSGRPERLTTSALGQTPTSWASATDTVAFIQRVNPETFGVYVLPMSGPNARKPSLFIESRFALTYAEFSPDGRWMTYVSSESGAPEVYVQPYPGPGEKIRISTAFGTEPLWAANGRELLYRGGTATTLSMVSTTIRSLSPFQADPPRVLFEAKALEYDRTGPVRGWDATADGQRFLFLKNDPSLNRPVTTLHVVLNWVEELKRRVPRS